MVPVAVVFFLGRLLHDNRFGGEDYSRTGSPRDT
jgi:hypothetical protein